MHAYYCDTYELPLPAHHRFPMAKYRKLRNRVEQELHKVELRPPDPVSDHQIRLAHHPDYVHRAINNQLSPEEIRALGFPWSKALIERSRRSSGATIMALAQAMKDGFAINLAGGTHHAHYDRPQGYCLFNDSVIAARSWQQSGYGAAPVIIDCDVHQGNGSASILEADPSIFTFSIHSQSNFPAIKANSDLDVSLPDHCGDDDYLESLDVGLKQMLKQFEPDCVIYVAGADPFEGDRLGKLNLTKKGLQNRDKLVFEFCRKYELPCAVSMAGGYAEDVNDIVDVHFTTVQTAVSFTHSQI